MKNYLTEAIRLLKPNAEFAFSDNDYSTIEWHVLDGKAPSKAEIDAAIEQIKAAELVEQNALAEKRQELLNKLGITEDEAKLLLS